MLCILSTNRDIFFNLAAEEYFLKNSKEEFLILWQADDSVVVGKHQNAMAEVNYLWALKNNIQIARRLTGGGTVYHGAGNLNFTFIRNGEEGKLIDFKRFVSPIVDYLHSIGVPAATGKRNDILVEDLKISGNAEHVFKKRVLHHGTLLFDADLSKLKNAIQVDKKKYRDKAVQSVRSQVTNISNLLKSKITILQFESGLFRHLQDYHSRSVVYKLTRHEINTIDALRSEKYRTPEWIYGYSPPFEFSKTIQWHGSHVNISLKIHKGYIQQIHFEADVKNELWQKLEAGLKNCFYHIPDIQKRIHLMNPVDEESTQLAEMFF